MRKQVISVFLLALIAMIATVNSISLGTVDSPDTQQPPVTDYQPTPYGTRALTVEGEIVLDDDEKYVDTTPGETGLAIFTGTVTAHATGPGANSQQIRVDLWVSDSTVATTVSPSSVVFISGGGSNPFTLSMRIPPDQDAGEEFPFTLHGTATLLPGGTETELDPAYGKVIVAAVIHIDVSPHTIKTTFMQGDEREYRFDLKNRGNSPATVSVELVGAQSLAGTGIHCRLEEDEITVPGRGEAEVVIHVTADDDAQTGINHQDILMISTGADWDTIGEGENTTVIDMNVEKGPAISEETLDTIILASVVIVLVVIPAVLVQRRGRGKRERLLDRVREMRREKAERGGADGTGDELGGPESKTVMDGDDSLDVVEVVEVDEE